MAKARRKAISKSSAKFAISKTKAKAGLVKEPAASYAAASGLVNYARLEARVSPELKERFQYAANIQGRSLTDFMIAAMEETAAQVIRQHQVIELSARDQRAFVKALLNPPEPSAALRRAFKRYKQLGL